MIGRRKPYTARGITRVPCVRCGEPGMYQWQCCANGNLWMALCADCDVALNRMALEFVGHPETETLMQDYEGRPTDER